MRLQQPNSKAVIDVPDEVADRYLEAGYTKADGKSEPAKAATKKTASKRKS